MAAVGSHDELYLLYIFQNQRIRGLLEKCTVDHETRMETLQNEMREKALSDAKWRQVQQDLNQSVSGVLRISFISLPMDLTPIVLTFLLLFCI